MEVQIEKKIDEIKDRFDEFDKKVKDSLKIVKDEITEENKKISEVIVKQGEELTKIRELRGFGNVHNIETKETQINKFIEDNHNRILEISKSGTGSVSFHVEKAPTIVTTGNATNPDGIPELVGTQIAPPSNINLRGVFIDGLITKIPTTLNAYPYTETLPKDGDFTFLGETDLKQLIDFTIETRYATPKKIAAATKLSTEVVKDVSSIQSITNNLLRNKHDLKRQEGILYGDGTGVNPKGATSYGRAFVAGAMALDVVNPNIMDVINACVTDIYQTHNYEDEISYQPTIVLINPFDFYLQFVAQKNLNGDPLYPQASLFREVTIGGLTIIPARDSFPVGKIFIADLSKYNITDYEPYKVTIGYVNDDFLKNQFCILGESRFHAFVKKLDEQAFIYDDIDKIRTDIKKV